jgi:integrase/recombinase XerD
MDNKFMNEVDKYLQKQSVETRRSYSWMLHRLIDWMEVQRIDPACLSPEQLEDFLVDQHTWKPNTRRQAICAARSFYRWWRGANHPILTVKLRRTEPEPQRTLSPKQAIRLLAAIDPESRTGPRDLAIVTLMLDTGLRESEIARLETKRVNIQERKLTVIVKGGCWGKGVFSETTANHLRTWLRVKTTLKFPPSPSLFISLNTGRGITPAGIKELFERLSQRCGFVVSPHDLRRTFATLSTKAGAPTRVTMAAGRWNNLEVFERYTKAIEPEDMEPWFPVSYLAGEAP